MKPVVLSGPASQEYVQRASRLIRCARLNQQFPKPRPLQSHLGAMGWDFHGGHYPTLGIAPVSGLPEYREWARVQADKSVLSEVLRAGPPKDNLEPGAYERQRLKYEYHDRLRNAEVAALDGLHLALRSHDGNRSAWLVQFDKLDASGCFVRFTVELEQTRAAAPVVSEVLLGAALQLSGRGELSTREETRHAPEVKLALDSVKTLLFPLVENDAEWSFQRLSERPGVAVGRVEKGTIGPFYFSEVTAQSPNPISELTRHAPGSCIGTFGADVAGKDVLSDKDEDPLAQLTLDKLSGSASALYRKARESWGYHVFKSRKFVASPELVAPLKRLLVDYGVRCVVYPLR